MDMRIADRLRAALAAALLLILMTGCGSEPKASPDTQETCLQIGMLFDNFVMERWERDRCGGRDIGVAGVGKNGMRGSRRPIICAAEWRVELLDAAK